MSDENLYWLQSSNSLLLGLVLAIFIILLYKWSSCYSSPTTSPPSPPNLPILGNLHQLGLLPHRSLQALAHIHGNVMLLHFGNVPVLIVSSPEAAREVMKTQDLSFSDRPDSKIFRKLLYNCNDVSTAPYGKYWKQVKGICVSHLLGDKRVQSFRGVREEETRVMLNKIEESMASLGVVNLTERFITLTNDVIGRIALGRKYSGGEEGKKFNEILEEFMELLGRFYIGDYIPWLAWLSSVNGLDAKLDKVAKWFDEFLDEVIQEHNIKRDSKNYEKSNDQDSDECKDFVDVLLWIQKENITGSPLGSVTIKALILDMFAAGTDSYTILDWSMSELLRHPNAMRKLQDEVRGIAANKTEITEDDLAGMHYLKAVMKETLRLHPQVPLLMPRKARQDTKVQGFDIKANTVVIVNGWRIGRDANSYENPDEFKPERFLSDELIDVDYKGKHFQLIPFGAGRRACPGINFAMILGEIGLANLVHKFNWELPNNGGAEELDMSESNGLTLRRKHPLKAIAVPYSAAG